MKPMDRPKAGARFGGIFSEQRNRDGSRTAVSDRRGKVKYALF